MLRPCSATYTDMGNIELMNESVLIYFVVNCGLIPTYKNLVVNNLSPVVWSFILSNASLGINKGNKHQPARVGEPLLSAMTFAWKTLVLPRLLHKKTLWVVAIISCRHLFRSIEPRRTSCRNLRCAVREEKWDEIKSSSAGVNRGNVRISRWSAIDPLMKNFNLSCVLFVCLS